MEFPNGSVEWYEELAISKVPFAVQDRIVVTKVDPKTFVPLFGHESVSGHLWCQLKKGERLVVLRSDSPNRNATDWRSSALQSAARNSATDSYFLQTESGSVYMINRQPMQDEYPAVRKRSQDVRRNLWNLWGVLKK